MPADIYLDYGGDFNLSARGVPLPALGWDYIRQRIVRRVFTVPASQLPDGSYTVADNQFAQTYGFGAARLVGQNPSPAYIADLKRRVAAGISIDADIDPTSKLVVTTTQAQNLLTVSATIKLLSSNEPVVLSITITN